MSRIELKSNLKRLAAGAAVVLVAAGCVHSQRASVPTKAPAAPALYRAPPDRVLTSTLLDFDSPLDSTFVDSPTVRLADDPTKPGNHVLVAGDHVRLNLTSLVRGRDIGGAWDVVGVRLWSDRSTTCEVELITPEITQPAASHFALAGRAWTKVWLTVPRSASSSTTSAATAPEVDDRIALVLRAPDATAGLLVDNVALAQSHVVVSESQVPKSNERWRVEREGLKWIAAVDGHEIFELPAAPFVPGGYHVLESDPTRALFINDAQSTLCIDRTGRLIEDGKAKLDPTVLKFARAIAENASPATIEVVGGEGRVERTLPGDQNNDGYDERRGCYAVRAIGGRATVRLSRQAATVRWPAIEVYDLPPGPVTVWLEGAMVEWAVRAEDGRVIVELPVELDRPIEVQIRVR